MNKTGGLIKHHLFFFLCYMLFAVAAGILLLAKGKEGSFLLLNSFHSPALDVFFIYYTYFGDGLFAVLLSLGLFFIFRQRKLGLVLLIAYAFTGIIAQIIKPVVESPRPQVYFSPQWLPFFIKDVIHGGVSSFPSGHTVTAFALATVLGLNSNNKLFQLSLLLLAAFVGFSRVYLSQHFLVDALAGSFIGVAGAMLCMYWCRGIDENKLAFKKSFKL